MQTRCPNPNCRAVFDVAPDREGKNLPCPACGQVITVRSLELLREIERRRKREKSRAALTTHAGENVAGKDRPASAPEPLQGLLEDVRSLWNVGSIFRSADGAGFGRLHLCGITGCPPRKELAKTALGAEESVAWEHHVGVLDILPRLREQGVRTVALERTSKARPLSEVLAAGALRQPLCLLVGNEVAGLSAEALAAADMVCALPMRGEKSSLNVAVAFGIAAYLIAERVCPSKT